MRFRSKLFSEQSLLILMAIVPCVLFYIFFHVMPIIYALYLSFNKWTITSQKFVGLANFVKIFTEDHIFYIALKNTAYYSIAFLPACMVLALAVAFIITNLPKKAIPVMRAIYFVPVVTSIVACAVIWKWLYQPRFGLFNQTLNMVGFSRNMWLESSKQALLCIVAMNIWKNVGYSIVLFLAGLQGIPSVFSEAAEIDGASKWQILTKITVPLLKPTIAFVLITGAIACFQVFTSMFVMTQGGPIYSTRTIVYHLYLRAFDLFQMGYASALAFILFMIIMVFTSIQLRITRVKWEY